MPNGPRITDNRTTTATIGVPVPLLFGTADLAGTVIWLAPMVEHKTKQGGKGGPVQTTFSYTQSIAIGLCERVDDTAADDVGAIGGMTRVWENGTLVFDIRPQQQANTTLGTLAETDAAYAHRLQVSAQYAEKFTLYLGDELQEADPTIEAVEGFGNAPGFRGLAYIVYPDRQLQNSQGLRHPSFTFECYQNGTGNCTDEPLTSNEVLYPWFDPENAYTYTIIAMDSHTTTTGSDPSGTVFTDISSAFSAAMTYLSGLDQQVLIGYTVNNIGGAASLNLVPLAGSVDIGQSVGGVIVDPSCVQTNYNFVFPHDGVQLPAGDPNTDPSSIRRLQLQTWWQQRSLWHTTSVPGSNSSAFPPWDSPYSFGSRDVSYWWFEEIQDLVLQQDRKPGAPRSLCYGLPPSPTSSGYAVQPDGSLIKCDAWTLDSSNTYKVLQKYVGFTGAGANNNYSTQHPLGPALRMSDPHYSDAAFWTAAYNAAVTAGTMQSGLTYGGDYPVTQPFAYIVDQVICEGSGAQAKVAEIISAICKRAGLTAEQIDVTDLTTVSVSGYSISSISDAANIISPLRSVAFFDCVESGNVLRFPTRGKEIVATLTEEQIGCYDSGSTGNSGGSQTNIPPSVAVTRQDETTLPRSIRFHYKGVSRDYQNAEQQSPFRLTTRAVDDQDISIPLCIGDVQAAQAAEIIWSDAWAAQKSYAISIDQSLAALEGADCIGVPVDGVIQRMRIVSDSNAAFVLRKLALVGDNQGSYISFAVASPPQQAPSVLTFLSPTLAVFLNIPALQDSDDNAGFYVVAYPDPAIGNRWPGATFWQSIDGTNYTQSVSSTQAATVGTLQSSVPVSESFTWDDSTVITVNLPATQSFESRTDDAVLAGANAAAMGADGRWEIIQFATATQVSPTQWHLSRLLRGRRGTEHVLGTSLAGDQFVMVSTGDLVRIPLSVAQIGAAYVYKVVTDGTTFSSGSTYDFASLGTALIPFSPVDAAAESLTGGDILIIWTRRDRLGRTLMSGVDMPISDPPLAFEVDICSTTGSPTTVYRTLASSTSSALYTLAQQIADFGSAPALLDVRIFQISPNVGRGTPCIAAITVT